MVEQQFVFMGLKVSRDDLDHGMEAGRIKFDETSFISMPYNLYTGIEAHERFPPVSDRTVYDTGLTVVKFGEEIYAINESCFNVMDNWAECASDLFINLTEVSGVPKTPLPAPVGLKASIGKDVS